MLSTSNPVMLATRIFIRRGARPSFLVRRVHSTTSSSRANSKEHQRFGPAGLVAKYALAGGVSLAVICGYGSNKLRLDSSAQPDSRWVDHPQTHGEAQENVDKRFKGESHGRDPTEVPVLLLESGYPFQFKRPLSPAEVTRRLNENTWSYTGVPLDGVVRYDGMQITSNGKCEDRFVHGCFASPWNSDHQWGAWGVFDGHVGGQTAEALSRHLLPYVHSSLKSTFPQTSDQDDQAVSAIQEAFLALDNAFVKPAKAIMDSGLPFAEKILALTPASNGSCALLALYDPVNGLLRVACTGDSRAVLGRKTATGWEAVELSVDQNGYSESEIARITAEHPGEESVVKKGRVLGLACTRAFGDAHWKLPADQLAEAKRRFNADAFRAMDPNIYRSPPYVTARPEVTTTRLDPGQQAFLVIATDGLWDTMTSKDAVDLVGQWLEWQRGGRPPVKYEEGSDHGQLDLEDVRRGASVSMRRKVAVQDENAAVHLARNGLGGTHHDLVSGLLGFQPPFAREVRDDTTVQVVFFE